jgi:fluoroacetyl-CoA thioesterase
MDIGLTAALEFLVTEQDTADALLSGDLPVLGTPRLVAWLEAATCAAIAESLPPGRTSVGTRVSVEHRAASPVGAAVTAHARLTHVDGRVLTFEVVAHDGRSGAVLGSGEITRAVVGRERFLAGVRG